MSWKQRAEIFLTEKGGGVLPLKPPKDLYEVYVVQGGGILVLKKPPTSPKPDTPTSLFCVMVRGLGFIGATLQTLNRLGIVCWNATEGGYWLQPKWSDRIKICLPCHMLF